MERSLLTIITAESNRKSFEMSSELVVRPCLVPSPRPALPSRASLENSWRRRCSRVPRRVAWEFRLQLGAPHHSDRVNDWRLRSFPPLTDSAAAPLPRLHSGQITQNDIAGILLAPPSPLHFFPGLALHPSVALTASGSCCTLPRQSSLSPLLEAKGCIGPDLPHFRRLLLPERCRSSGAMAVGCCAWNAFQYPRNTSRPLQPRP